MLPTFHAETMSSELWSSPLFTARKRNVCFPLYPSREIPNSSCRQLKLYHVKNVHVKEEKKSAARVSAMKERLCWHCPPEWTVLLEAQEAEVIHTASTSKFRKRKMGRGHDPHLLISFSLPVTKFLLTAHFRGSSEQAELRAENSLLLPYLPSLYALSLFHHGLDFCWMTWIGSPIHAISECLREGALSQSQSRGRVETSIFWRR